MSAIIILTHKLHSLGRAIFHPSMVLLAGSILLFISSGIGWFDQPLLGQLNGNRLQFSPELPQFLNYGLLFFLIALLSLLALFKRLSGISFITAVSGFFLLIHLFLDYAIIDIQKIERFIDLNEQKEQLIEFSDLYLPPNRGTEPNYNPRLKIDTFSQRVSATFHFATFGLHAALLGTLFLTVYFFSTRTQKRTVLFFFLIFPLTISLYLSLYLPFYLKAEYLLERGNVFKAQGNPTAALTEFQQSQELCPQLIRSRQYILDLGEIYFLTGQQHRPEYDLYLGRMYHRDGQYRQAIFYYQKAADSSIREVISYFTAKAYLKNGLENYEKGLYASASAKWEKALVNDPTQIQAYFYLSRSYYQTADYEKSIIAGFEFFKRCRNNILNANVSANVADSYYKLEGYGTSRDYYLQSLLLDNYINLRALMSLAGK